MDDRPQGEKDCVYVSHEAARPMSVGSDGWEREKRNSIIRACELSDAVALKDLAQARGGLLEDELRQRAWPILLGLLGGVQNAGQGASRWQDLPPHKDEDQVEMDVRRSFVFYPTDMSPAELDGRKSELSDLIVEILRRYPCLSYFQGYHDICQVFLLVLEPAWRSAAVARLSLLRIRDFMLPSLGPTVACLSLLPEILELADGRLRRHISNAEPSYALAGTLTMYSHNIQAYGDIVRLFDVLLAREPIFSLYVFAQIVLDRRAELLATSADDLAMLHLALSKVPEKLDLDSLISDAAMLFEHHRPESLPSWRRLSRFSAFRITCGPRAVVSSRQSLADGERCFRRQAREIQWAETRTAFLRKAWYYRRPLKALGMAVVVGAFAFYLQRGPGFSYLGHLAATVCRCVGGN